MKRMHHNRRRHRGCSSTAVALCGMTLLVSTEVLTPPIHASSTLDGRTQQAMIAAINDEYHARAFYNAVIEKFGSVRPFSNIVRAEKRHVQRWHSLFTQYQLPIPEDTFAGKMDVPETLYLACQKAIEAEIANVQMYDEFLEFVEALDLRDTFTQLRNVSQNNHKPAFERCISRLSD